MYQEEVLLDDLSFGHGAGQQKNRASAADTGITLFTPFRAHFRVMYRI